MKYLIAGLGNIGPEYVHTRHNIGFDVVDKLAADQATSFSSKRYADYASFSTKGRHFHLIKPTTYMNLSGKAVRYWLTELKLTPDRLLVIIDDIALPTGKLRLRPGGSDGGHNGLKDIDRNLGHHNYARLRFGVGNDFPKGAQANYVLSRWPEEERELIAERITQAAEIVVQFGTIGLQRTMNQYNNK